MVLRFQIVHRKGQPACSAVKNVTKITLMQGGKFQRSGNLKSDDTSSTRLVTTIEVHEVDNHPQDKPSD